MPLPDNFTPAKPFQGFKWKWASLQCTEGINDPVVLLGVLFRLRALELANCNYKYSSEEFAEQMRQLSSDIEGRGINVDLARRTGSRNIIRNSGQYWKTLGLIPENTHDGVIRLTDFGRMVADRRISQAEFAAIAITSFRLPNRIIQSQAEFGKWAGARISIRPLHLVLSILMELFSNDPSSAFMTKDELTHVVIPLSGCANATPNDYARFIVKFRTVRDAFSSWPNCCEEANDHRIAREFLIFLSHYGYLTVDNGDAMKYNLNTLIADDVIQLLEQQDNPSFIGNATVAGHTGIAIDIERKRYDANRRRPNQARFRHEVLGDEPRCVITNVMLPEVLEAAHIIPYKYHGEDTRRNGLCMRMDIHQMFDTGTLRISPTGQVCLTDRARLSYGMSIPPTIQIPSHVNRDFIRWRWENYNGI